MPLVETLPPVHGSTQWSLWNTTARIVVADAGELDRARLIVDEHTRAVERACSRFTDSELTRLPDDGRPARVSALLGTLVTEAVRAARRTGGDVDPTLGRALCAVGYDRDFVLVPRVGGRLAGLPTEPTPSWRRVRVEPDGPDHVRLTVPAGARLDLGATAKAWCADRCAADVAGVCGTGVLVALGGDVATGGLPRFAVAAVHRGAALLSVVFLAVHVLTLLADPYAQLDLLALVVPFTAQAQPLWYGLGAVALDLVAALVATSLLRHRLPPRVWRGVHLAAFPAWTVALVHGLGSGSDAGSAWLLVVAGTCALAVAGALVLRLSPHFAEAGAAAERRTRPIPPARRPVPPSPTGSSR